SGQTGGTPMTWPSILLAIRKAIPAIVFGTCYVSLFAIILLS
ncbi:hypothetical protein SAMN05444398_1061, partial [Roseovarius pacificus]